nr:MAG TPA: hypothetical protein [Bacteriophage sp.]
MILNRERYLKLGQGQLKLTCLTLRVFQRQK